MKSSVEQCAALTVDARIAALHLGQAAPQGRLSVTGIGARDVYQWRDESESLNPFKLVEAGD
jgi:hypothetical protein